MFPCRHLSLQAPVCLLYTSDHCKACCVPEIEPVRSHLHSLQEATFYNFDMELFRKYENQWLYGGPVSYTHLDVYKRQTYEFRGRSPFVRIAFFHLFSRFIPSSLLDRLFPFPEHRSYTMPSKLSRIRADVLLVSSSIMGRLFKRSARASSATSVVLK